MSAETAQQEAAGAAAGSNSPPASSPQQASKVKVLVEFEWRLDEWDALPERLYSPLFGPQGCPWWVA